MSLAGPGALPGLRRDLDGVPGTAERGRVAQVDIVDTIDGHAKKQRRGIDVDALGHRSLPGSDDLCIEELPGLSIAGDAQAQAPGARVVRLVIPGLGLDRERVKTGVSRVFVAQPRAQTAGE